jgi:hypothetical protein
MNIRAVVVLLVATTLAAAPASAKASRDSLCAPLRAFVASVGPDEKREIVFRTAWLGRFKDEPEDVMGSKRCEHNGYKQAKDVCAVLMTDASVEFGNTNAMRAIECLSPKTRFYGRTSFERGMFSLRYGTENRGALIDLSCDKDPSVGGMALRIVVDGY